MYTLVHGFYKYLKQKDEYCVLILGLDAAGKSVNLKKLLGYVNKFNLIIFQYLDIFRSSKIKIN